MPTASPSSWSIFRPTTHHIFLTSQSLVDHTRISISLSTSLSLLIFSLWFMGAERTHRVKAAEDRSTKLAHFHKMILGIFLLCCGARTKEEPLSPRHTQHAPPLSHTHLLSLSSQTEPKQPTTRPSALQVHLGTASPRISPSLPPQQIQPPTTPSV